MAYLTNNSASTIIKKLYEEFTGKELATASAPALKDIIDVGTTSGDFLKNTEQFFKKLFDVVIKNFYTDTSYTGYKNPWMMDSQTYGAILQSISIEAPDIRESGSWQIFTDGETTLTDNDIFLTCKITNRLFGKNISFELPISITENQLNESMRDANALNELVGMIQLSVRNKILVHLETIANTSRNNFIAEKIDYSGTSGATGTHVVNLVKDYCDMFGITSMTASAFLKNADAMRWASKRFDHYKNRMSKMSKEYNTEELMRFTPNDRIVFQIANDFSDIMESTVYSNTYNPSYITLENYEVVPYWQYEDTGYSASGLPNSMRIKVKTANNHSVDATNVVGFMADKWCIRQTIIEEVVRAHHFDRDAITTYYNQFKMRLDNDLSMNAIVFVIADVSA